MFCFLFYILELPLQIVNDGKCSVETELIRELVVFSHPTVKMADVPKREVENVEFVFEVMGSPNEGIDAVDLGDALRSLNLNPTLALIEKMGGTKKRGEKKLTIEEFLPIYSQVKKEKDQGCYEDFIECLKLYDKAENGTMLLAELQHALLSLGENLEDEQVEELFADCMDPEDDDGFIPYSPFLARMCDRPDQL
ncbi:myosin light chain alkali isoform X2 [Lucilia cuprina]|uniref:myosin light chain alkali isoform X2 n=1 Tax=Lucilia cuprina TaxID=7375 RepID=UPI001F05ACC9|nr:myosin light chain alkali isoform X2 [Lucilia cuprina]